MDGIWQFPQHGQAFWTRSFWMPHPRVLFAELEIRVELGMPPVLGDCVYHHIIPLDFIPLIALLIGLLAEQASRTKD